jgi:Protein of unknown function (DUF1236)
MINRLMVSAAAVALIAGTGFANAQGTGMGREGSPAGSTAQQSAPSTDRGNSAAPANRDATESTGPSSGMKAKQSEKSPTAGKNQRADENLQGQPGQKSKSMSSDSDRAKDNMKGGSKEMKAEGREDRNGMKAEGRQDRNGNMNAETKGAETRTQTTVGQAGAGAKLSTEQRTRISTIIRDQHVQAVGNVDFEIRPGIRITRDRVSLRPLPSDVVTIYPEWRGYEFFLVNNRIVVVDPRTLEIVDVIDV